MPTWVTLSFPSGLAYITSRARPPPTKRRTPDSPARKQLAAPAGSGGGVRMDVGGGVRVRSSSSRPAEAWGSSRRMRGGAAAIRCSCVGEAGAAAGGLAEDHYRTLRLRPGATRAEVKKAFRRLALLYHPDVCKERDGDGALHFQRINVAYQVLTSNMREAEERLEYWRLKYGLSDQDLDKYRLYLHDFGDDEWFDV